MNYPTSEGKYGIIYQIAEGIRVGLNQFGSWELTLKRDNQRKKKTFGTGNEALERAIKAAELLAAKLKIPITCKTPKLFSDVAQEWLQNNRSRWALTTNERYFGIVRDFLNPTLGKLPFNRVDRQKIKTVLSDIGQIRAAKSTEVIHAVISGIFSEAIDLGYTENNPARGLLKKILPPKCKRNQKDPDPFNKKDLDSLLTQGCRHLPEPLPLILTTLAFTGMRLGECLAMSWRNLDVTNSQYMVCETTRQGKFGLPKTGKRLIDFPEFLTAQLEEYIKRLRKEALRQGEQVNYLFPGITQRNVQGAMRRACLAAKLRVRSPHDLRHTYATLLLMDHYSPAYVQKQLGHHSITMTVDIYGHWLPGEGKKDLEKTLSCPNPGHGHGSNDKKLSAFRDTGS